LTRGPIPLIAARAIAAVMGVPRDIDGVSIAVRSVGARFVAVRIR